MPDFQTLAEMRDQIGRHIQDTTSSRDTKVDEWINTEYSQLAREFPWPQILDARETGISVSAGQTFLYLPKYVKELYVILPSVLQEVAPHQVISNFLNLVGVVKDTSSPIRTYADAGEYGRKAEFSSTAETLEVSVTGGGAGDTFTCVVQGTTSTDDEVTEEVAITNGANATTTNSFTDLRTFSVGGHTKLVTLTGSTSSTVYATVGANEVTARYKRIRVWGIPPTAETLAIYFKRRLPRLTSDNQVPEIPVSDVIVNRVISMQYSRDRRWGQAAVLHRQLADRALESIMAEVKMQGERLEQGVPFPRPRGYYRDGTVVVRNS